MKYTYFEDKNINVRDYIVKNYTPYDGDESFLCEPTNKTLKLWLQLCDKMKEERSRGGIFDVDVDTISTVTSHNPGYINKRLETIVGLQTDEPLKRAVMPFGGIRLVYKEMEETNRTLNPKVGNVFKYRKTHNDGVFDVYSDQMKLARHTHIITGLPDAYGRGRIIGDYRRVALYGVDYLIEQKKQSLIDCQNEPFSEDLIRLREEISEQIKALNQLKEMAKSYGFDISKPATDTKEAIQWLYFGYLGAVKDQNGAAMSLGRVSTFLDIYAERDLKSGKYTESQIQEFVDHFVMKLRIVRFLRTSEYDKLFSGDPTWVTESIGGMCDDGRHMVTKMSYRFLHTLTNLGPAPEPNLTILWSKKLPANFKKYCAKVSIKTSSIQYENDDIMRPKLGDDYGIACCVSAMRIGKQMQFFGARANLGKALLYAINGGVDEMHFDHVTNVVKPITTEYLNYNDVIKNFDKILDWLAGLYINTLNAIHYMHDKYCYEALEMALHDNQIVRTMAGGIAGLSVVADSLSAIKYAKVKPIRNEQGIAVDFEIEGDFPKYGNNDERVDKIAVDTVNKFIKYLRKYKTYRNSIQTLSVLTITSNVVYGKNTGSTPDGRKA
ncbi:MAG: formate acetyltransferase, partial [Clostridiales bacterium]|nr:formate acetyltransferase [Clostridiales bacterium]